MISLLGIAFVAVFLFVILGMVAHSIVFGSIAWLIVKKASDAAEAQRPKPCAFCGSTLLPEAVVCSTCGGPRDPQHVAGRSSPEGLPK